MDDFSAIDAMAHGDERAARQLRADVAVISRRTDDPDLRHLCRDILAGRQSVRRMFEHPSFWAMADRNMANLEQGLARLSDEERESLMDRVGEERTDDAEIEALTEGEETDAVVADREAEARRDDGGPGPDGTGPHPGTGRWG
jgi:hypothetical protein